MSIRKGFGELKRKRPTSARFRNHRRRGILVTILFPCLNESACITACVSDAKRILKKIPVSSEVLVADNNSSDGSGDMARIAGARVVNCDVRGYGASLACGISAARGRYVLMLDADGSYDPRSLPDFLDRLVDGDELVVGNRFLGGIERGAMPWINRYLGNPVLSFLGRRMFGLKIGDFHCGIRAFQRKALLSLNLQSLGMEYASEMIVRGGLAGLRIGEVPVALRRDRRGGPSHLRPWRDGWRHLRFLLLFSPRWLFLGPGLGMVLVTLAMGSYGWREPNEVWQEIIFLVCCNTFIAGYQFVLFGAMTQVFGVETGFLPTPRGYKRLFRFMNLERGIFAGFGFMGVGLYLLFHSVTSNEIVRILSRSTALGGTLLVSLGLQTVLASFMFSFLGMSYTGKASSGKMVFKAHSP